MFNKNKETIPKSSYCDILTEGCYVKIIIELASLWKNKNNVFGLYLRPHQAKVEYGLPPINTLNSYAFNDTEMDLGLPHEIEEVDSDSSSNSNSNIESEENNYKPFSNTEIQNIQSTNIDSSLLHHVNNLQDFMENDNDIDKEDHDPTQTQTLQEVIQRLGSFNDTERELEAVPENSSATSNENYFENRA